ncbi:MAG: SDR family NAD(P)-dependent oxidoreductase [Maritimibacter harenae]|jgi:NAD(P)-dependent dehydrogenase (short-subunit alcohol dehydrogenase family)|uniref:SDR family NAD(P)-dependent oxidoreductase n=1 Tax=Maritimibacter harenae TaxID=2606218 RepID=A0A845M3J2_9RHOB|nr:SDR family NAD(P)-dependent oxidoreductase [Maritimibacter harenae]MZR12948.1 SDR family NAD(P)-dependent oxidoreductase [Maritimibacter harenae]
MQISKDTPVVVTGGASGLGAAVARAMAAEGAPVGIFDLNEEAGEALAKELGGVFAKVDVSDPDSVTAGFETVRAKNGQERIMVNCAGIGTIGKTVSRGEALDPKLFVKTLMVNTAGTFNCASQSALGMTGSDPVTEDGERGVIINTASVAAFDGQIGQVSYSASKGAVAGMTLPMARDLSKNGIRVMTIAPGLFLTPMMEGLPKEAQESLGAQVPFPSRLGRPDEYAAMARHIVENSMLNGEVIRLDGAIRMAPK